MSRLIEPRQRGRSRLVSKAVRLRAAWAGLVAVTALTVLPAPAQAVEAQLAASSERAWPTSWASGSEAANGRPPAASVPPVVALAGSAGAGGSGARLPEPSPRRSDAGSTLARGAGYGPNTGSQEVRRLQRRLRRLGFPPGRVDGLFGPLTEAAVRGFQKARGLAVDGIVGDDTWRALRSAAQLRRGDGYAAGGSDKVRRLQGQLRRLGYQPGPVDGLFGARTETAVRHFQRTRKLAVDGIVGPSTAGLLAKLDRRHRDSAGQQPVGHPAAPRAGHSSRHTSPTKLPTTGEHDVALLIIAAASTLLLALLSYTPRPRTSPGGSYLPDPHSTARALDRPAPRRGRFKRVGLSPQVVASWRSVGGALVAPTGASAGTVTQGLPTGRRLSAAERALARSEEHGSVALKRLVSFLRVQARIRSGVYAITPEPKRDWTLARFVTGHRLAVLTCMTLVTIGLYSLQELLWPHAQGPRGLLEQVWSWGSLLWLGAVVPGTLGLLGMLSYVHSRRMDWVQPIDKLVAFRIVSRGTNIDALVATIRRCQSEMAKTPLFPYLIEVVTDTSFIDVLPPNEDITYITVPSDYRTPRGSLYKARALHYALQESEIPDDAWIVHLDEETQPTSSGIKGICAMIREEEGSGRLRVGQGAILYHRTWRKHPFLTLADNVRTGDDFARFHFQHKLGVTVFGLHGSYIVVRNDLEKSIGFDFGPVGSITEDAFWALVAMQAGHRCRWVDGYLEEQSTQSIRDFVRQRRRWFQGLAKVALHAPVRFRWRVCIGTNTLLWALAPFAALYTVGHLFYGFEVRPPVHLLANLSFASFATLYLIGLKANLDEYGVQNPLRRAGWAIAQMVLLPAFTFMEGIGVLSAIVKPASGFHVVKK